MADNSSPSTPNKDVSAFNANETKIITAIMQNLTSEIQFDAEKVAAALGYKDAGSLRARWNAIKRAKISGSSTGPAGGVSKGTPTKKSTSTPKKVKAGADELDDDDEEIGSKKKTKSKKGVKKGKAKVKTEEEEDAVESVEDSNGIAKDFDEAEVEAEVEAEAEDMF